MYDKQELAFEKIIDKYYIKIVLKFESIIYFEPETI